MSGWRFLNRHALRFAFDLSVGVAALALFSVNFPGLVLHELIGLAFAVAAVVHIALSWDWAVGTTRRCLKSLSGQLRLTWLVNAALFISMTTVIASGLVISEVVLPRASVANAGFWHLLHTQSSNASLALVGLHLGLNWRWVVDTCRRHVLQRVAPRRPAQASGAPGGSEAR